MKSTLRLDHWCLGLMILLLGGCLPIELSVRDGQVLIPRGSGFHVYDPAAGTVEAVDADLDGEPAFAQFQPGGEGMLLVTASDTNQMGGRMTLTLVEPDGDTTAITEQSNVTYARFAPDGQTIALTRVADQATGGIDENMPELLRVSADGGDRKTLAANVSKQFRWTPDGEAILAVHLTDSAEQSDQYRGHVVLIDAESGEMTKLASVVGPSGGFVDIAPDGESVLFTAHEAGAPDAELAFAEQNDQPALQLFHMPIDGEPRAIRDGVRYGIYAPDGEHVLLGREMEDGDLLQLWVADADFTEYTTLASDVLAQPAGGSFGPPTEVYPFWVDENTVGYIAEIKVYGTAGKNMHLVTIDIDGDNRTDHQAKIDGALD